MTTTAAARTSLIDPFVEHKPEDAQNSWRATAIARARRLWFVMTTLVDAPPRQEEATSAAAAAPVVGQYLECVCANASDRSAKRRIRAAFSGERVDAVTINLHAAEVVVARYLDDEDVAARLPRLLSQVEKSFPPNDPRRAQAERCFKPVIDGARPKPFDRVRDTYVQTLQSVHDIAEQQLDRLRKFRNQVLMWSLGLSVIAAGLAVIGALAPAAINLCFEPSGQPLVCPTDGSKATGGNIAIVLVLGLAGAALSVAFALRNAPQTSAPYNVSAALLLLKLPCGALTALVGLLLIRGGFVPGFSVIDTKEQVLGYAVLFGFAQQLLTRMVDLKGREVLDRISNTEPPASEDRHGQGAGPPLGAGRVPGAAGMAGSAPALKDRLVDVTEPDEAPTGAVTTER